MMDKLQDVTDTDPDALHVFHPRDNHFFCYCDENESILVEALFPARICFEDLTALFVAVWHSSVYETYYKALMKVLEKPIHPSGPYKIIAKENPWVLVAIAVGVEANMMSIETDTDLFEGVDIFKFNGDEEEIIISPPLTGPSPERLQVLSDRFKPLTGEDLPKGDVNTVATFVFDKLRIPITAQPDKPVTLNLRQLSDTLARCFVGQPDEYLRAKPPSSNYDTASELVPNEWNPSSAARMADAALSSLGTMQIKHLYRESVPPRDVACPEVARDKCDLFIHSNEPLYPSWLKDILSKVEEKGGNYGAPRQPDEDFLVCPSDGQTSAPNPTAGPTISCPPSAEAQAERPSSELNSLEGSTARECNATEAPIESCESFASERSSSPVFDEGKSAAIREVFRSEFKAMLDTRDAALREIHTEFIAMFDTSNAAFRETIYSKFIAMFDNCDAAFREMVHSKLEAIFNSSNAAFIETIHSELKGMLGTSIAAFREMVHSEFKGMLETNLAAFRAELENFRISERQRSAKAKADLLIMLCVLVAALIVLVAALAVLAAALAVVLCLLYYGLSTCY